ncbi:hypothetical protein PSYPI_38619, partial [Pseudomonas syringae pv. pisi str. 1704B]
ETSGSYLAQMTLPLALICIGGGEATAVAVEIFD